MMRWWIALGSAGAFTALAVAVHLGLLNTSDSIVREWARPHDIWGSVQLRAGLVVEGLRPTVLGGLLAAFTVAYCVRRRSLRPAAFVGGACLVTVALTVATKTAVGYPDPHGSLGANGGSFPSGHMTAVIVCLGLPVLVAQQRPSRWLWLLPALGGGLMGACLLLQAAHWATDVVGGGLLGMGVLAVTTASGWTSWSHTRLENDETSAVTRVRRALPRPVGLANTHARLDTRRTHLDAPRLLRSWPGQEFRSYGGL
jgi:membrane-associated phospholipid phosphatase